MAYILWFFFALNSHAASADVEFFKKREKSFHEHEVAEEKREEKLQAGREEIKKVRQKHESKIIQARDNFKREMRSQAKSDQEYQKHLAQVEERRLKAQERYAQEMKPVYRFMQEYVVPMKAKEYDIGVAAPNAD